MNDRSNPPRWRSAEEPVNLQSYLQISPLSFVCMDSPALVCRGSQAAVDPRIATARRLLVKAPAQSSESSSYFACEAPAFLLLVSSFSPSPPGLKLLQPIYALCPSAFELSATPVLAFFEVPPQPDHRDIACREFELFLAVLLIDHLAHLGAHIAAKPPQFADLFVSLGFEIARRL